MIVATRCAWRYHGGADTSIASAPLSIGVRIMIRDIENGAGFVVPILGPIMRMPGLPEVPASEGMDIDAEGKVTGLS